MHAPADGVLLCMCVGSVFCVVVRGRRKGGQCGVGKGGQRQEGSLLFTHSFTVAIVVPSHGMECAMICVSITSQTTGSDPIM